MRPPSDSPEHDPNLSGLGRALLNTGGSKPSSGPWVPPTAEELHAILPQYEIVKMLGRGGMGAVYMGRQTALDRPVAIKILSAQLEESDMGFTERFKNEARAMGKLNHPAIVSVYEFGEHASGLLYIVMEYVDGTDVARMIAKSGRLHTEHAMAITAHVCDALAYAHERGIIHRDIKPANIMVGYDGMVKVADFGLAKVSSSGGQTLGLTQSGMAMGTLHFMAPEALMLGTAVDHRADIYAVGVMLYQMLTGKLPQGMFKLPSLQIAGLDPRYDGIIAKAMMEDREARYQSAREMRAGLDGILTQPVVKADPAGAAALPAAALPTQARPQLPGGAVRQPYRPPQSRVAAHPEKRGSLMYWVVVLVLCSAAGWMYLDREKQTAPAAAPQETATTASVPTKAAAANTQSVPAPMPPVAKAPAAPAQSATAPVTNAYAWLIGTWAQSYGTPPTPALSMELRSDYTAEMTAGGKTVQGRWNLSGKKLGINWANGHLHEIAVNSPESVTELTGKGTPPQGGSFPLIYRKGVSTIASAAVAMTPTPQVPAVVKTNTPVKPTAAIFTNSLGMKFIDVPGTEVRFCIHETRRQDYAAYASKSSRVDESWDEPIFKGVLLPRKDDHPVTMVSWEDAVAFTKWLSQKEGRRYRLTTSREWSLASGLAGIEALDRPNTPGSWNQDVKPWGTVWPPPAGSGNFADAAYHKVWPSDRWLESYTDGFANTAPVMSFQPSSLGLYDLAGNIKEMCMDDDEWTQNNRVVRGSSFADNQLYSIASSHRDHFTKDKRSPEIGFRIVLEGNSSAQAVPASRSLGVPTPTVPPVASATIWVDVTGRSIQAKFVRVEGGDVIVNIAGKLTPLELSNLSAASQQIARDLQSALQATASKNTADTLTSSSGASSPPPSSASAANGVEPSFLGLWYQHIDGNDHSDGNNRAFQSLAFFADGTSGFGWEGKGMGIGAPWTIINDTLEVRWPSKCIYRIDLKSGTATELSGTATGGKPSYFTMKIRHTGLRPAKPADLPQPEELTGLTFDFLYHESGHSERQGSNGLIRLSEDGKVEPRIRFGISNWHVSKGLLHFTNERNETQSMFNDFKKVAGKWQITGLYIPVADCIHTLKQE